MKTSIKIFFAMVCSSFIATQAMAKETLDKIIATVNDSVITQSELNTAIHNVKKQIEANHAPMPPADVLHKQVLEQLINHKLQLQLAEQAGITASDEEIDNAVKNIAEQNHVTEKDVYERAASQGLNKTAYRNEIHEEMIIQRFEQKEVGAKINITPQEVNDFMHSKAWQAANTKEYHLEDVLVSLPEAPSPEQVADTKKRADALLVRLRKSKNFSEEAATESSNDNAVQGGDLGWRKLPEVPSAFAEQLLHMNAGEIVGPIQTPNGFHIIHLIAVRQVGKPLSAEMQRKQIQQLIYQRKMEEGVQSWLRRIRSGASINMHPEN